MGYGIFLKQSLAMPIAYSTEGLPLKRSMTGRVIESAFSTGQKRELQVSSHQNLCFIDNDRSRARCVD